MLLAALAPLFTNMANASEVLPSAEKQQVAQVLEEDAQLLSNTQLETLLKDQPEAIQDEVVRINTEARPIALQIALIAPILAALLGFILAFRMVRLPDLERDEAEAPPGGIL
ncbi:hypothetical protein [Leifsonia poae]|uniref:hypothetical protein n=1 Tax=Leifsonia poae TaxID=110933 RepID=UPI003D675261